jgi:hypothetical protein
LEKKVLFRLREVLLKPKDVKWTDPEFEVLLKLYRKERLTVKDHFAVERMYKGHGASSVYMAMRNLSGKLPHINKRLAEAAKKRGIRKKP